MNMIRPMPSGGRLLLLLISGLSIATTTTHAVAQPPGSERFIPAAELEAVFEHSPAGVVIPRAEFDNLLAAARRAVKEQSGRPAEVLIRSATYRVRQQDSHAIVELDLDIQQYAAHWVTLSIPTGNLQLEDARIADEVAAVRPGEQPGSVLLVHEEPGRFTLSLKLSTPLAVAGADRLAAIRLVDGVAGSMTVACPQDRFLQVDGQDLPRPAPAGEPAEYRFPIGSRDSVRLKWTNRRESAEMQTLIFCRSDVQVQLNTDTLRWNSTTRVSVFGNRINQLVARVPAQLEVTSVDSKGLESWKLEDDPDNAGFTRVLLNYRQPFQDDRIVTLSAVAAVDEQDSVDVPTLEFLNVTAHAGRLLITQADGLRLTSTAKTGVQHQPNQTADAAASPPAAGEIFDFWLQDYELTIAVRPRDRELFAQINSTLTITDTEARLSVASTLESLNRRLFSLQLHLPTGWQVIDVTDPEGNSVPWRNAGAQQIEVTPAQPVAVGGLLSLTTVLKRPIAELDSQVRLELPVVTIADAVTVAGTYSITSQPDLKVTPTETTGLAPVADQDGVLLFETQDTSWSGRLTVARRTPRLAARSVLRLWQTERQQTVQITTTVDVSHGTQRKLTLLVSEDLGADLNFQVESIGQVPGLSDQKVPTALDIAEQQTRQPENGLRPFELTFDRRFAGAVTLTAQADLPVDHEAGLRAPVLNVQGAPRQHGLLVFEAYPTQQLTADEDSRNLRPADAAVVEPPPAESDRRVALVYRFVQPDYSLSVTQTQYSTAAVPSAICRVMDHISVVSETGRIQRSSTIRFLVSGVQTLHFALPDSDDAWLWSTVLNGEPVEVRREQDQYLVAIPSGAASTEHELKLLFETTHESGTAMDEVSQQTVELYVSGDGGDLVPVQVLMQTWDVFYPDSSYLTEHHGGFVPDRLPPPPGWLAGITDSLRMPSTRTVVQSVVPLAIMALALFVGTVLIVRRRWKTLFAIIVMAAVVVIAARTLLLVGHRDATSPVAYSTGVVDAEAGGEKAKAAELTDLFEDESVVELQDMNGMTGGGFGGGGFGGDALQKRRRGEQESDAPMEPAMPALEGLQLQLGGAVANAAPQEPGAPPAADSDRPAPSSLGMGRLNNGQQAGETAAVPQASVRRRSGAARLSVLASLEVPKNFQRQHFRSIGASDAAGELIVVLQSAAELQALRWMAAGLTVLIFIWVRSRPVFNRLLFVLLLGTLVAAAVPLIPQRFQPLPDGIAIGMAAGIVYWIVRGAIQMVRHIFGLLKTGWRRWRPSANSAATAVLLLGSMLFVETASLVAQEDAPRPDVVLPYPSDQPALTADKVFLPKDQFLKLYRQAYPDRLPAEDPQQSGATVVAAFYESQARRQVDAASWSQAFQVRFVVRSFSQQASVRLPLGPVAIRSATLNADQPVLLTADRSSASPEQSQQEVQQAASPKRSPADQSPAAPYRFQAEEPGLHLLDVVFEIPATIENSVGTLRLPVRPVAAGVLTFELPAENLTARINGRSDAFRREDRRLVVPVSEMTGLSIEWLPRTESGNSESLFHADSRTALVLDNVGRTLYSHISLVPRQGSLSEVDLKIPQRMAVQSVDGADVTGWSIEEGESRRLKVVFREAIEDSTSLQLTLFERVVFSTQDQTIDVPIPSVPAASRDSGYVAVVAGTDLELRVQSLSGVQQMNASDAQLPPSISDTAQPSLAWRYTRQPAEISVRVFRTRDRTRVTALHGVQLERQRQLWTTQVTAEISGSPRQRLELRVPDDFLVLDVAAHDLRDWYLDDPKGGQQRLTIQFTEARRGMFSVVLQGQRGINAVDNKVQLLPPAVLAPGELNSQVSVWLSDSSAFESYTADDWRRVAGPQALHSQLQKLKQDEPAVSFASSAKQPQPIALKLRRRAVTLSPESVLITTVTDTSLELTLALNWKTDNAVTQLSFSLPSEVRDAFDFQVAGLRQIQVTEGEAGRDVYQIQLQQPVRDRYFLLGTATLPLPVDRKITPHVPRFVVPDDGQTKLSPQSHFWVLVNQSAGLLTPEDNSERPDDILPEDIKLPADYVQQSVAIQRLSDVGQSPTWQLSFPETQQVAPAVITLAAHQTVFASDGSWRSRHDLRLRNESRQYLPVAIPDDSQFLFCTVDGRPTRVVRFDGTDNVTHLIPIPQSGVASALLNVRFALSGHRKGLQADLDGATLAVPLPTFPDYREDALYGITVVRSTWQVFLPDRWTATIDDDPQQTNVVRAEEEELEDASLLSVIDNARASVATLKSTKSKLLTDSLYRDLQSQQQLLSQQKGNRNASERLRQKALTELQEQLGELGDAQQLPQGGNQAAGAFGNSYLLQMDSDVNRFNSSNTAQLLLENSGPGVVPQSVPQSGDSKFRFVLPEQPVDQGRAGQQGQSPAAKKKSPASKPTTAGRSTSDNRSKLIEQRESNLKRQLDFSKRSNVPAQRPAQSPFDVPVVPQTAAPALPDPFAQQQQAMPEDDRAESEQSLPAATPTPAGTLSLAFELPTDGIRYDFARAGGNPELTLRVRSRKSVRLAIGLVWAAACCAVLFVLLKAQTVLQLLLRLAVLAAIVGLLLVLVASGPVRALGALLCVVSLLTVSILTIVARFRKHHAPAAV